MTEIASPALPPECWRTTADEALPTLAERRKQPTRRDVLASVLGLDELVEDTLLDADQALRYYTGTLDGTRFEAWDWWYDSAYSYLHGDWLEFSGETPTDVLEELNIALQLGVFDDVEIWTREGSDDFVALGLVFLNTEPDDGVATLVPIVRWGLDRTAESRILAEYEANAVSEYPEDGVPESPESSAEPAGRAGDTVVTAEPDRENTASERRKDLVLSVALVLAGVALVYLLMKT